MIKVLRWVGVVSGDDVNRLAVRSQSQRVRSVLAATLEGLQFFDFVELIVACRIGELVKPAARAAVDGNIKSSEGVEHALRGSHADVELLNFGGFFAADWRGGDPEQPLASLVTRDDASLVVEGQADPRSLAAFVDVVKLLNLKTGEKLKDTSRHAAGQIGRSAFGKDIAPGT